MKYVIELKKLNSKHICFDRTEYADGVCELKTFLSECVPDGYCVSKIRKVYKDGRGFDVTKNFKK